MLTKNFLKGLFIYLFAAATVLYGQADEEVPPSAKPIPTKQEVEKGHVVSKVIDDFLKALSRGMSSQAYYAYASEGFRKTTSYKQFKMFLERYPSINRSISFDILNIEYADNVATVTGNLTSIDHYENTAVFDVIYETGRWHILGIQLYLKQGS